MAFAAVGSCLAAAQVPPPYDPLSFSGPQNQYGALEIEQKLDAQVDLDLTFRDETGSVVRLGELTAGKPAILALVYYECPMLCNEVLNGVEVLVAALDLEVGREYSVITVTIDPGETPEMAAAKKQAHLARLNEPGAASGWHFLTDLEGHASELAQMVGFRYAYDAKTDQYAHAAGIIVLTPRGKVSKYYHGIEYIPRDVKFGLMEAAAGRIGTLIDQVAMLCFQYDPTSGRYGFYVIGAMRIGAVLTLLGLAAFWITHWLQTRSKREEPGEIDTGTIGGGEIPEPRN